MTKELFLQYLPAILTFIVGVLGVFAQLIINYLSEHSRNVLDKKGIRRNNANEYYIPLLYLLREYEYCYRLLNDKSSDSFDLSTWNYPNQESMKKTYERFRKVYSEIAKLSRHQYIPTDKELHKEIQQFIIHVVIANSLWTDNCEKSEFTSCLPTNQQRGYQVDKLIALLEKEITSI